MKPIQSILTQSAPVPIGAYSQAVRLDNLLFVSGQLAIDALTGQLIVADVEAETRQVIVNLQHILQAAGSDLNQAVKVTLYLINMDDFEAVNRCYSALFAEPHPARTVVAVSALPKGARVVMDVVASCGE